jgi:hypothetical protein
MTYEEKILHELKVWQRQMLRSPGYLSKISKAVQNKINSWIPEKVHKGITVTIKQMVRGVLFGAKWTTREKKSYATIVAGDIAVDEKIKLYRNTAATEGAITGAGGILLGLADFPLLLAIKLKLLFEIASIYGYSTNEYKERLFILHIFQLAFSSPLHRKKVFLEMKNWDEKKKSLPDDIHEFDWRNFQQEYRDYIDLAKMAQLVPVIGAPVGAIANFQLIKKLGRTAKNAYHMRWAEKNALLTLR